MVCAQRRCGFDYAERLYVNNLYPEQHILPSAMLHHNIEWVAEGGTRFISMPRRTPFFLYVGWTLPHNPEVLTSLQADPRLTPGGLWGGFNRSAVVAARARACQLANVSTEALLPLADARGKQAVPMATPNAIPEPRFGHRHYPLALAWMDSGVGSLMEALRESDQWQNTLTIFTSDHAAYDKAHCYTGELIYRTPSMRVSHS